MKVKKMLKSFEEGTKKKSRKYSKGLMKGKLLQVKTSNEVPKVSKLNNVPKV